MISRSFACAACGRTITGRHAQAVTCSPSCRVWLCRHPERRASLVGAATAARVSLPELLERKALAREHPDLYTKVDTGEMGILKARTLAWARTRFSRRAGTESVTAGRT